jgi:hypothetical protein
MKNFKSIIIGQAINSFAWLVLACAYDAIRGWFEITDCLEYALTCTIVGVTCIALTYLVHNVMKDIKNFELKMKKNKVVVKENRA